MHLRAFVLLRIRGLAYLLFRAQAGMRFGGFVPLKGKASHERAHHR